MWRLVLAAGQGAALLAGCGGSSSGESTTVQVSTGTVFGDDFADGLASVTVGSILKVYGIFDASTGITTATRIALKAAVDTFRLRSLERLPPMRHCVPAAEARHLANRAPASTQAQPRLVFVAAHGSPHGNG